MDVLSIILGLSLGLAIGLALGVSIANVLSTKNLLSEVREDVRGVKRLLRRIVASKTSIAFNNAVNASCSNRTNEVYKLYKSDNAFNIKAFNIERFDTLQAPQSLHAPNEPPLVQEMHASQTAQHVAQSTVQGSAMPIHVSASKPSAPSTSAVTDSLTGTGGTGSSTKSHLRDPEVLKAEILRLRAQGLSTREIGRRLGCSHTLVAYYLKKMS